MSKPDKTAAQWGTPANEPSFLVDAALGRWRKATKAIAAFAAREGLSKAEAAKRVGMAASTFSEWYSGTYKGDMVAATETVEKWLASIEEIRTKVVGLPEDPGFVETRTAQEMTMGLVYAQATPEMAVITLGAGMGKTRTCQNFAATRPHVFHVTMRPTTGSVHGMLAELCLSLKVQERNPARLDRGIGEVLRRNGRHTLLIVDEAQNLKDDAVNQLRYFLDEYGCGIALVGNEELYGRWGGNQTTAAYAQIRRRIGFRLRRMTPYVEDIVALLDAYKVEDVEVRRLLTVIGKKPGALGEVAKTLRLASMIAAGADRALLAKDIEAAWANRQGDDIARAA